MALPCSWVQLASPRVGFDDLVQVEQDLERAFENDDHWRSVVPSTRRLVVFILSYALRLVKPIAEPISLSLHLDRLGGAAGVGAATVLSVVVLVLISFAAGIVARTAVGRRISRWSESSFLGRPPHYQVIKSMAEGVAHIESASGLKPALVSTEDGWQIGYLLEKLENEWVVVFLPQAPTPMSGNVMYLPANRVRPLGITMVEAMSLVKAISVGSGAAALRGVDLKLPSVIIDQRRRSPLPENAVILKVFENGGLRLDMRRKSQTVLGLT